jgi:hypothetical protein
LIYLEPFIYEILCSISSALPVNSYEYDHSLDYAIFYHSAISTQGSMTITTGDTLSCYYEYFAQELYEIKYEMPDLNISTIIQTKGNLKFSKFVEFILSSNKYYDHVFTAKPQ